MSDVAVVVVAYNAGLYLQRCINALACQTHYGFEAAIIDNASTDGSIETLILPDERFRMIRAGRNLGFAAANNLGARATTAPLIACLNPDAFAAPDWLERLLGAADQQSEAVMFGSLQIMADAPDKLDGAGDGYHISGVAWRSLYGAPVSAIPPSGPAFAPCAAASLYRRPAFEAVGGFDESFFCYHEDVDLAFRLRLMGGTCWQDNTAVVHHVGSAITGRGSSFAIFHGTRNRIWTFVKNMPGWTFWALLPAHILANLAYLLVQTLRGRGGATLHGMTAAIMGLKPIWAARRQIQKSRVSSITTLLQAMTWTPLRAIFRR